MILVSIFVLVLVGIIITTAVLYYNRKKKFTLEKSQFQNAILQAQLEIQEQTFKNISQEIHDNIGQILSLTKLNLATLEENADERLKPQMENARNLVSQAIQDLRQLAHGLNSDYVTDMGLPRAVEHELEMISRSGVLKTEFALEGEVRKLGVQRELILFRILQELLNNILRHAEAAAIAIRMDYGQEGLQLSVGDDGKGFDVAEVVHNRKKGMGILNIYDRARLIHADIIFHSVPGKETIVRVTIPY